MSERALVRDMFTCDEISVVNGRRTVTTHDSVHFSKYEFFTRSCNWQEAAILVLCSPDGHTFANLLFVLCIRQILHCCKFQLAEAGVTNRTQITREHYVPFEQSVFEVVAQSALMAGGDGVRNVAEVATSRRYAFDDAVLGLKPTENW